MGAFRLFGIAVMLTLVVAVVSGCGDNSQDAAEIARLQERNKNLERENRAADRELRRKERQISRLEKRLGTSSSSGSSTSSSSGSPSTSSSSGSTSCGGALSVGSNTTCSFAENVRNAYLDAGGGNVTVSVYSPVTDRFYDMNCRGGAPTVCTGGNNASVYIR